MEWLRRSDDDALRQEDEALLRAKMKSEKLGKAHFDLDLLLERYDPSSELSSGESFDRGMAARILERRYFLDFRDVRSMEEFAERLRAIRPFR